MKRWLLAIGVVACGMAHAQQTAWFTVTGDPLDKAAETVQVDPQAIEGTGTGVNLRVNRAQARLNWDGIPYRSYESRVMFDCLARRAVYVEVRFYAEPLWQGEPHEVTAYSANPKPMLFRDMRPNPTARIVRAACKLRSS